MSKMYNLALLLFCFSLSMSALTQFGLFSSQGTPDETWIESVNSTNLDDQSALQSIVSSSGALSTLGDIGQSFNIFIGTLINAIVNVKLIFELFGVPSSLASIFAIPIYIIWAVTIVQFLRGLGFRGMT